MSSLKAILMLFAAGSGSFFCASAVGAVNGVLSRPDPVIRVRELEAKTQDDQKGLAERTIVEGKVFEAEGSANSLRKALERYEHALKIWRSLRDRRSEAGTLQHIGVVHYRLDERQKALEVFQQELQLWRSEGDGRKQAETLNNLGVIYGSLGLTEKAIESYQQALPLRHAAADRSGLATTLDNIGLFYLHSGELEKALDYFNQALTIYRALNVRAGIANAINNIGGVHMTLGDNRKALDHFVQALELRRALGHRREEAMALNNIGRVYEMIGEAQKGLDYHRQALELRRQLGEPSAEAASINNIGFVYGWLGEKQKALEHFQKALELFRAAGDRPGEASTLNNIGGFYVGTERQPEKALEYYLKVLEMRRALRQTYEEAMMLDNIGLLYLSMGDPTRALDYHRQALALKRTMSHRPGEAYSFTNLGSVYFSLGDLNQAFDFLSQALPLHRKTGFRAFEAGTLFGIARVQRARGNLADARLRMEEALEIIESLRGKVASQDLRASYLAQQQEYYEFYTDLLIQMHQREPALGHDLAALQASERARARSLLELLAEARIDIEQGIAPELKQRERVTHSRITWLQSRLIETYAQAQPDQARITGLEEDLKKADADRQQLNMEIRQQHPRYADLQYPEPLELKAVQSLLDDQSVLLEYALGKDASFLFAVSRNDFLVVRLPPASSISEKVQALRLIISSRPQRHTLGKQIDHSRQLYRDLIEPAGKLLAGKQKLIIVPSGILHYLPFEALLSAGEERTLAAAGAASWPYLMRDYAVSYVPSAGVLASLRNRPAQNAGTRKAFLAFADPVYGNETGTEASVVRSGGLRGAFGEKGSPKLARLIESRREVEQISRLFAPNQVSLLLGQKANEENVKTDGRLGQYRYVHFATHGLLNEEMPHYSGLILSLARAIERPAAARGKPGQPNSDPAPQRNPQSAISNPQSEDGLLQVYEVFDLKINADLVVLSACETGLGKEVKGEGLVGLTHSFLYAGTPSVLVSLWNVQDRSTADLMVNLYQELDRGRDKAEALRQAKLKVIRNKQYAHPYYWAPFVLVGEAAR